jgi:hypothetical protein
MTRHFFRLCGPPSADLTRHPGSPPAGETLAKKFQVPTCFSRLPSAMTSVTSSFEFVQNISGERSTPVPFPPPFPQKHKLSVSDTPTRKPAVLRHFRQKLLTLACRKMDILACFPSLEDLFLQSC